jgi:hypothetical protein
VFRLWFYTNVPRTQVSGATAWLNLYVQWNPNATNLGQFNLVKNLQSHLFKIYFNIILSYTARSRDNVVGIAIGHGLDGREVGVWVPVGARFFFLHVVQTDSWAHPSSYTIGTGATFCGGKAAGALSWPLISNQCRGQVYVNLQIHSPIRLVLYDMKR